MKVCEVNFGGEIGTRPAAILKQNKNTFEVVKITNQAKAANYNRYRLSGFSGVRGYAVTDCVYTVPKVKVIRYTNTLFKCEQDGIYKALGRFKKRNNLKHIIIKG